MLGVIAAVSFYVCNPPSEKLRFGLDLKGGTSFTLGVDVDRLTESIIAANPGITNTPGAVERKVAETLKGCDERIIQVIRRRVDAMGTNEPVIQGMKDHRLLVQLPGADEEVRKAAKANLQSAAFLEFRLTHPKNDQLVAKLLGKDRGQASAPPGSVRTVCSPEEPRTCPAEHQGRAGRPPEGALTWTSGVSACSLWPLSPCFLP